MSPGSGHNDQKGRIEIARLDAVYPAPRNSGSEIVTMTGSSSHLKIGKPVQHYQNGQTLQKWGRLEDTVLFGTKTEFRSSPRTKKLTITFF